jgi:sensor histidine kinase YesM
LTEDWCFQVKKDGKEIYRVTRSKIEESVNNRQLDIPQDYLIAGIGMWLLLK